VAIFAHTGNTDDARAGGAPISGRALGLQIDASFGFPGLRGAAGPDDGRRVRMELVSDAQLELAWATATGDDAGATARSDSGVCTEHRDDTGYLISSADGGRCLVDPAGQHIRIAPGARPEERWQRLVAGHALPLAAILQGLEVFNASAVVVAGQVMALVGPPGIGKSALATQLMLLGARFFADDLVALEIRGEQIAAHAGLGVVRLGPRSGNAVPALTAQGGDLIGHDGKTLVECSRDVPTLPLRSLYLLRDVDGDAEPDIAMETPDPSRLLAGTHHLSVCTPERLRRRLELVTLLSARVGIFSASLPPGAERKLARAIYAHAALVVLR